METTWKGGRNGHLWSLVKSALETPEEQKGPLDWRVVFFPWQHDPKYKDAVPRPVGEETARYFAGLPASAGEFSPGQMSWYQRKRAELGMFVLREFPTVMEECFQAPVEGAIYAESIDKLRAEGAIRSWKVDRSALIHTAGTWEARSILAVWFFQVAPSGEIRVSTCDMDLDLARRACVSHVGQGLFVWQSLPAARRSWPTQKSGRTFLDGAQGSGIG